MRVLNVSPGNRHCQASFVAYQTRGALSAARRRALRRSSLLNYRRLKFVVRSEGLQGVGTSVSESASLDLDLGVEGSEHNINKLKELYRTADLNG